MTKPGDVVEFTAGLHGFEPPRNIAVLLDRRRVKGVPWVRVMTAEGEREIKAEHVKKRAFRERYDGDLKAVAQLQARVQHLVKQHATGGLAEEAEDDLGRLEEALWESTCDEPRASWTEEEVAQAHYRGASPQQLRDVRQALDACRRAGTGRFQTVAGRGDRWRPWSRAEHDAMRRGWQELADLRRRLVVTAETDEGRSFTGVAVADAGLTDQDQATLSWVRRAMVQFIEWDGVPDGGEPVAGIAGSGAVRAFGMDLHKQLAFLAQDWIGSHTTTSSDYIQFLLGVGLWNAQDAVDSLIRRHVNQEEFFDHVPDERAQEAALRFPEPALEQDPDRTDLRHIPCWTIDPPDARDFDDAVGIEATGSGERLWVHVADVSQYVVPDTTLDRHAKARATSVYLPGRVLPMLPPRLSDHLCSLRSDGDRFALSVALDVAADGRVTGTRVHKAIIRVTENLAYATALERARAGAQPFAALLDLAGRMRSHRRGLELETGELKVLLEGSTFSALEKRADDATRMIETFMVAANEAVARHLSENDVAQLYRCHPLPDLPKAERFRHQLHTMGFDVDFELPRIGGARSEVVQETLLDRLKAGGGKINLFGGGIDLGLPGPALPPEKPPIPGFSTLTPEQQEALLRPFRDVLDVLAADPDEGLTEVATWKLLACMGRAFYTPDNQGHFGLASTHYCHFTSPIRRYPDLVVHRNLKWLLAGRKGPAPHTQESLRTLCDHCSNQERAADQLERRIKASCLVLASLGESGSGQARITGITPASLFVARDDGIEARVPARELPGGPYQADEWESMLFRGARDDQDITRELVEHLDPDSGEVRRVRARLGQRITVALAGRNVADGRTEARVTSWAGLS